MATGSLFFSPFFQFMSSVGLPYAGGSLAFYSSGTNTPLAVYADQGLTTALQNPVPLESGGWPANQIWLQTEEYRVVLSDVNGVEVWAADPVASGGQFTGSVVVSGTGQVGFEAINSAANGNTWGWYSQPDGTFVAIDSTTGITPINLNGDGVVSFGGNPAVYSQTSAGITLVSVATSGQEWDLFSQPDGTFALFNASNTVTPFFVEPNGSVTFQFGVAINGVVTFNAATNFTQAVSISAPFTSSFSSSFSGPVTFNENVTFGLPVTFSNQVTFSTTDSPLITSASNPGLEMTNTAAGGRSWFVLSESNGSFEIYDGTAATGRVSVDQNGTVLISGGAGTGSASYGFLSNTGAGTQTGTYGYGLSVPAGITSVIYSATSDRRLKSDIEDISETDAWAYVMAARPVTYLMAGISGAGFIAQEDAKGPRAASVSTVANIGLKEVVDDDGFVSPAGFQLTKNYDHDIAYLTRALQSLRAELDELKKGIV